MKQTEFQAVDREQLAAYLGAHEIRQAEAVGDSRVYRCTDARQESLAIALPDGNGLIIAWPPNGQWTGGAPTAKLRGMSTRILLVEDDERLAELTAEYLSRNDLEVAIEGRGDTAEARILSEQPDLVILDVMLPGKDGFEVCRAIRPQYRGVILMLTARDEDFDQILGLELGADDYIAKPVQPRVLLARIKALLRRLPATEQANNDSDSLVFGQFTISQATRTASLAEQPIDLTTAEFDLLWLLASHAGNVLSRDDLLQELRGIGFDGLDRSIDARISRLRKKLNDDPENPTRIKTVRGKGYLFSKHDWN